MKKIIAITLLFMFLLSSVCMAYTPSPDRWGILKQDSEDTIYYDKSCCHTNDGSFSKSMWILWLPKDKNVRVLQEWRYLADKRCTILSTIVFDNSTDKMIGSEYPSYPYQTITPETTAEKVFYLLFPDASN